MGYMTSKIYIREISFICILFTYAHASLFIILTIFSSFITILDGQLHDQSQ
jgi:hypothetical protein